MIGAGGLSPCKREKKHRAALVVRAHSTILGAAGAATMRHDRR